MRSAKFTLATNSLRDASGRILIAPDKFKGTLTARQAAEAIARGWQRGRSKTQIIGSFSSSLSSSILPSVRGRGRGGDKITLLPISDGGDGFGSVLGDALGAKPQRIFTVDAAHRKCVAKWWWQPETHTAIIESANVIGLAMLPRGRFHPFQLDTFGLGKVLHAAAKKGAKKIILGIGQDLSGRLLLWDALDARFRTVKLRRDPACALCGEAATIHDLSAHGDVAAPACSV